MKQYGLANTTLWSVAHALLHFGAIIGHVCRCDDCGSTERKVLEEAAREIANAREALYEVARCNPEVWPEGFDWLVSQRGNRFISYYDGLWSEAHQLAKMLPPDDPLHELAKAAAAYLPNDNPLDLLRHELEVSGRTYLLPRDAEDDNNSDDTEEKGE